MRVATPAEIDPNGMRNTFFWVVADTLRCLNSFKLG